MTWAYLEFAVDVCIATIHHSWDGKAVNKEIPRTSFARKLAYFRDWHTSDPKYEHLFHDFLSVVDMLEEASEHRHRLIHGMAANLGEYETTGFAKMYRSIRRKDGVTREEAAYTAANIKEFRNHAFGLAVFMGSFAEILTGDPVLDNEPHKSLSALFEKIGGFFPKQKRRRDISNQGG